MNQLQGAHLALAISLLQIGSHNLAKIPWEDILTSWGAWYRVSVFTGRHHMSVF